MSHSEAGKLGGEATSKEYNKDHYQEIGREGGDATASEKGKNFTKKSAKRRRQNSKRT